MNRRFLTSRTVKVRQHAETCTQLKFSECVDRWHGAELQKVGLSCSSSNTIQTVDERAARTCRTKMATGRNKPRWTEHHQVHRSPKVQRRSPLETEIYRVTEGRPMHAAEKDPVHRRHRGTLSGFQAAHCIITNLAMDKLGLVTKLVELNFPSKRFEVSEPRTLKAAPTLRTGDFNLYFPLLTFFSLAFSLVSSWSLCAHSFVAHGHLARGTSAVNMETWTRET